MLKARPPVVGVFGHIDHGKSTLIDYIRKSNQPRVDARVEAGITEKEAGGITQHVGAYEVKYTGKDGHEHGITFIDTPGHAAFGGIRERGARVADIAILIVSAEDGVKPQTIEAIDRIKKSETPFIVAITKIDKPGADIDRTKQSLAENNIYVEGYGGDVPFAPISAVTGQGIDDLLELISLVAQLEKFEYDDELLASGVIIESRLDPKRGNIGIGIIKNGVARQGLFAGAPGTLVPIRLLLDAENNSVDELHASRPIQIIGWDKLPVVGSEFRTFLKKDEAIDYARENNTENNKLQSLGENVIPLPLIIKTDVAGSLEAVLGEISKLTRERIAPRIISSGVGTINESDVKAALAAPGTSIFGFNVKVDARASALAERSQVATETFNIIYELVDRVKILLEEREPRIEVEEPSGQAKVLRVFSVIKDKQVLGGRMLEGEFKKGATVKIIRRESEIGKGKIKGLQQSKLEVDSVADGLEFGTMIESKIEVAPGDVLVAFTVVTK